MFVLVLVGVIDWVMVSFNLGVEIFYVVVSDFVKVGLGVFEMMCLVFMVIDLIKMVFV